MIRYLILFNYILFSLHEECFGISGGLDFNKSGFPAFLQNINSKRNHVILQDKLPEVDYLGTSEAQKEKKFEIPNIENVVKGYGYPVEKHEVTTDDGYILTLIRVKHGKSGPDSDGTIRRPVMLQHGLTDSAAAFLAQPDCLGTYNIATAAYYLADKGYDIWIGNSRGAMFSRRHLDKDRDPDKEGTTFWDFSFHEMGVSDLPAAFKKIQEQTANQKLHFIGYSMGTTQFLVMGSEVPQYLDMVDCVILMAPVARPVHMQVTAGMLYYLSWTLVKTARMISKTGEVRIVEPQMADSLLKFCTTRGFQREFCNQMITNFNGLLDMRTRDFEKIMAMTKISPLAASLHSYIHYLQIVGSGKFQKFDYGRNKNMLKYRSEKPPEYNLKNISKKLYLLAGGSDVVAVKEDVQWLQEKLPSAKLISEQFDDFTHKDFYFSENIEEKLYSIIFDIFKNWEAQEENEALENRNE